ncbi:MAG: putative transposase [Pseudonocardiales bacterium]|nr:putative transposase [Pseudonocardiales bacterium]
MGENRVARLCSQQRIWSVFGKSPGRTRKAGAPVHDDLVDRKSTANITWLTDIPSTTGWSARWAASGSVGTTP